MGVSGTYDAVLDDQDCGCTGTTHDVVYLPKPLRAGRHEVLDK